MAKNTSDRPIGRAASSSSKTTWTNPLGAMQYKLIAAGVGVIVLGFVLLSTGMDAWDNPLAVDVAPVVLVLGYCVAIPLAIMWRSGKSE